MKKLLLPVGSVMRKDDYLPLVDSCESVDIDKYGFISLHKSFFSAMWCLCPPLSLINKVTGERPDFEKLQGTFTEMLMKGIELAIENETFLVIVDDPITGKTMQPDRKTPQV